MTHKNLISLELEISNRLRREDNKFNSKVEIEEIINRYIDTANILYQEEVSEIEAEYLREKCFEVVTLSLEEGISIEDRTSDYIHWLEKERANIQFNYWNRYSTYLRQEKNWSTQIIHTLDVDSDKILDLLGNPKDKVSWHRKGLLIGDVQSGKTANYTAIINKAADCGFQVVILLTGTTETLRIQTQSRIDMEVIGNSKVNSKVSGKRTPIGVGKINDSLQQPIGYTTVLHDFNMKAADSYLMDLPREKLSIFVMKKNKTVLSQLHGWLEDNNKKIGGKYDRTLLLIDDEADNASVNTRNPEFDPTAINAAIRGILSQFVRSSYLAVTATPFANIFINSTTQNEKLGEDLFPSDYIYLLATSPIYTGADKIFGEDSILDFCIPIYKNEMETTYSFKHKKLVTKITHMNQLPTSMVTSIRYFLLIQAIMDIRPGVTLHHSMMINVTRFTNLQNDLKSVISEWLRNEVWDSLKLYSSQPQWADNPSTKEYYQLKIIWDQFNLSMKAGMNWDTFSMDILWPSISRVDVIAVNQESESINYSSPAHKEGYHVIAIGGFSLSRGITLEGLVVSYFYRNSKAYDTLLQMGRWFGYRKGYLDLCKLWIADESIDWYRRITEASNDLKDQIKRMNILDKRPADFGLAVQHNPMTHLIITAQGKMRFTEKGEKLPTTILGRLVETPRLSTKIEVNRENSILIKEFISQIDSVYHVNNPEKYICNNRGKAALWQNVPKDLIARLVLKFSSHALNLDYQASGLADYILNDKENYSWDVAFAHKENDYKAEEADNIVEINIGNNILKVPIIPRKAEILGEMLKVGKHSVRIGTGDVTKVGLLEDDYNRFISKLKEERPKDIRNCKSYLRSELKRRPILIIYPMKLEIVEKKIDQISKDRVSEKDEYIVSSFQIAETVYGIGLGFPLSDTKSEIDDCVQYIYNSVAIKQALKEEDLDADSGEYDE